MSSGDHIPLVDDAVAYDVKPTWRGWIHAGTFPLAIAFHVLPRNAPVCMDLSGKRS